MQPALYYRSTDFDPICAWCSKPLNEDLIKRLTSKKENHSTVQPNCGEHGCLIRNAEGENGWTVKRPITKKRKPKPKPKPKAQKLKKNSGRLTLGEEKKEGRLKQTALKIPSCRYLIDCNENRKILS